jgi:hypothetical protein
MLRVAILASETTMPLGVLPSIEFTAHGEAGFGRGRRDQLDNHPITDERRGTPILADTGEEPVLDFVPLADAGRQMADRDVKAEFVSQLLQFAFPSAPASRCCRHRRR